MEEVLLTDIEGDQREKFTNIIIRESERVDRLVGNLLRFAKPPHIKREILNLKQLTDECVESLLAHRNLAAEGIVVESTLVPTVGLVVVE